MQSFQIKKTSKEMKATLDSENIQNVVGEQKKRTVLGMVIKISN